MVHVVTHPVYSSVPLPPRHPFPMGKFSLLAERLRGFGWIDSTHWWQPQICDRATLALAHDADYLDALWHGTLPEKAVRKIGLPWSKQLATRTFTAVGGTLLTAELALEHGIACHLAGGTHHAHAAEGSGYCLLNDLAVTAFELRRRGHQQIVIIDADVHQGDGTARMCAEDPGIFTVSIHNQKNFPLRKADSDLDIPLDKNLDDASYLAIWQDVLHRVFNQIFNQGNIDLVIYDAGVDVHQDDRLGYLSLSSEGIKQRDRMIIERCRELNTVPCCHRYWRRLRSKPERFSRSPLTCG